MLTVQCQILSVGCGERHVADECLKLNTAQSKPRAHSRSETGQFSNTETIAATMELKMSDLLTLKSSGLVLILLGKLDKICVHLMISARLWCL